MMRTRVLTLACLAFVLGAHSVAAQELSRYRTFALEASVASVIAASGARESDAKTLHARPARIQQIEWRAPFVSSQTKQADPVHDIVFNFYDDKLYQIVVSYHPDRMEGLSTADVVQSLSTTYGTPVAPPAGAARNAARLPTPAATVLARWEDAASLVTLVTDVESRRYQLVTVSKALDGRARAAITEAVRMDLKEAPQRARTLREQEAEAERLKLEKTTADNKAGFRP